MMSNKYFCWKKELSHEVCQKLIDLGQGNWNNAAVVNKSVVGARKSDIVWTKEQWVYDLVWPYMSQGMKHIGWNYKITSAESYQIAKSEVGEFHAWHQDGLGQITYDSESDKTRKLSLSLLLNDDYEGGELEVFPNGPMKLPKGTMIFFPSFQCHQVLPVTKGTRYSLVMWFSGKPWQ